MSLGLRGSLAAVAGTAAAVLALTPLGRSERSHANGQQLDGIAAVSAAAAGLAPDRYRLTGWGDCLLYLVHRDPYALEVCYDRYGRGLEAVDRRDRAHVHIYSIRYNAGLSRTRLAPLDLYGRLRALGAFPPSLRFTGTVPLADAVRLGLDTEGDTGPLAPGQVSR